MKLKEQDFRWNTELSEFVNKKKIKRKDIQQITETGNQYTLFYWVKETQSKSSKRGLVK